MSQSAQDLVQEAVLRVVRGSRTWDPVRVPDLDFFLGGVMRSIVSDINKSPERLGTSLDSKIERTEWDASNDASYDAETSMISEQEANSRIDAILSVAADDPILSKVVEAFLSGCGKAADVAQQTGLPATEVYVALKKLRRRLGKRRPA
jgi:DNA-directed RNA polymerase specialized sigma24 family protein